MTSFIKALQDVLASATARFIPHRVARKSRAPEKATRQQPAKKAGTIKRNTVKPVLPVSTVSSPVPVSYDWRTDADSGVRVQPQPHDWRADADSGVRAQPRPEIRLNGGTPPPNMIDGNDGESYVATSFEDRLRPPGTTNTVVLPVFTDDGIVARLPNNDGSTVKSIDSRILSDIPGAGILFNAFGGLEMHDNAAGLSPQRIAFINGGNEYSVAAGMSPDASSSAIATAQQNVIARMNAVENRDGSKQVLSADGEYIRVGGKFGRATRENFDRSSRAQDDSEP